MTRFENLRLVTIDGIEAPADPSDPDSPYNINWYDSAVARTVANSFVRKVRWCYLSKERFFQFYCRGGIRVALDPNSELLLSTGGGDPRFANPSNAVVINPDGSLNHRITPPPTVLHAIYSTEIHSYLVERISDLYIDENNMCVIGLDFFHEWVERRYYDPAKKQWGKRVLVYRR